MGKKINHVYEKLLSRIRAHCFEIVIFFNNVSFFKKNPPNPERFSKQRFSLNKTKHSPAEPRTAQNIPNVWISPKTIHHLFSP